MTSLHPLAITVVALAACAAWACGSPDAPAATTDATAGADAGPSCPIHQAQPGGTGCCPAGTFWRAADATCQPVGPPECAAQLATDPAACIPRWCWDFVDAAGTACAPGADRCAPSGRRCSEVELAAGKGCLAGYVPNLADAATCVAAGSWSGSGVAADWAGGAAALPVVPALAAAVGPSVPALLPLPPTTATFFCKSAADAVARLCTAAEAADCASAGAGTLPSGVVCDLAGVTWPGGVCPKGYKTVPATQPGGLADCTPDPQLCSGGPYPEMPAGLKVVHVSAVDGDDAADGSAGAPVRTIGQALARVGQGMASGVAVAAGSYKEVVVFNGPVVVRGRCAAMTTLSGPPGIDTLTVTAMAKGAIEFSGFRIAGPGRGVRIAGNAAVSLRELWIAGVHRTGVLVSAKSAAVQMSGVYVVGVQGPGTGGDTGRGIQVELGAQLELADVRVSGCHDAGVLVSGGGTVLNASQLLVDGTLPNASDASGGRGLRVRQGATAELSHVRLSGNRDIGLAVFDAGTAVSATALLVDGTQPQQLDLDWGYGVAVAGGAQASLRSARLTANHGRGAAVQDPKSMLQLHGIVVDNTGYPPVKGGSCAGVEVTAGGRLTVDGVRLSSNAGFGAYIDGPGSALTGTRLLVDASTPRPSDGMFGRGTQVQAGAQLTLTQARLSGNRDAGLVVATKATAQVTDLTVDGTQAQLADGRWGTGVHAGQAAQLVLRRARLQGNTLVGLVSRGVGTVVSASEITIHATQPQPADAVGGLGAACEAGGQLDLSHARLSGNRHAALALADSGSQVRAWGLLIDGTVPDDSDARSSSQAVQVSGAGVAGGFGAKLALHGARVVGNTSAGVAMSQAGATTLAGVVVQDHASNATGHGGMGLMFQDGLAPVQLLGLRSARNRAAALALHASSASLDGCVLVHTAQGKLAKADSKGKPTGAFVALADGLVAGYTVGVTVARTLAIDNPRAGVLFGGAKEVVVKGLWATGGLYGVALENTVKPVLDGSWVKGSAAAVASDAGLDVPAAPVVVKLAVE